MRFVVVALCAGCTPFSFGFSAAEIVSNATPDALESTEEGAMTADDIRNRFHDVAYTKPTGYTIPSITQAFDDRLDGVAKDLAGGAPCAGGDANLQTFDAPDGSELSLSAQCHHGSVGEEGYIVFGKNDAGDWTIFERNDGPMSFVVAHSIDGNDEAPWELDGWFVVRPDANGEGSRAIIHLVANEQTQTVKMTGAYNIDVCGVTTYSDATTIYVRGSAEMIVGDGCDGEKEGVFDATNLQLDADGVVDASKLFTGDQFLRPLASDGVLGYPGAGNVLLTNAATSDEAANDMVFGPDAPDALGGTAL